MSLLQCKTCRKEIYDDKPVLTVDGENYCSSGCQETDKLRAEVERRVLPQTHDLVMNERDNALKLLREAEASLAKVVKTLKGVRDIYVPEGAGQYNAFIKFRNRCEQTIKEIK